MLATVLDRDVLFVSQAQTDEEEYHRLELNRRKAKSVACKTLERGQKDTVHETSKSDGHRSAQPGARN